MPDQQPGELALAHGSGRHVEPETGAGDTAAVGEADVEIEVSAVLRSGARHAVSLEVSGSPTAGGREIGRRSRSCGRNPAPALLASRSYAQHAAAGERGYLTLLEPVVAQ